MTTSLSTQFAATTTAYSHPKFASAFLFGSSALRSLTFDPFKDRRRASSNAFLVRSSLESAEVVSELAVRGFPHLVARAEGLLYTLADAAVSVDPAATTSGQTAQTSSSDWLSGITNILESFLKTLQDGLQTVHAPYSYGFAIILLTVIVKALTLPLTQKQVESSLAMQNLAPKVKAIQERYEGNKERIQLETSRLYKQAGVNPLAGCLPTLATLPVWIGLYRALSNVANEGLLTEGFFWIPSLAGPTTIAARQSGSGISWLFPFVDGQPPLGWHDTSAYLVLPVLLVISQFVSMQLMQTPQTNDPSQKNTQLILKFLPLMIGYFSLSVPSGLSLYWFVNNLLSTGQQLYLRKVGRERLAGKGDIITAGQALRSSNAPVIEKKERRGEKFKQLKAEKEQRKADQGVVAKPTDKPESVAASNASQPDAEPVGAELEEGKEAAVEGKEAVILTSAKNSLEKIYSKSEGTATTTASKRGKRSKRRRSG